MISAAFTYQKRHRRVLDREMAYVEVERATPSCCCTAISPRHISGAAFCRTCGREAAASPDLIGTGDSEKLPNSGPGS
jgi:haloalkane dehalogenase